MRRTAQKLSGLFAAAVTLIAGVARGDVVQLTQTAVLDYNQLADPGYLTTRDLVINSAAPGEYGPILDLSFTKRFGKISREYPVGQNWTGSDMIMFTIENRENRTVNLALACGITPDINNFTGGFACTAELPPLSTQRYSIVMNTPVPSTYGLKRLPQPFDGDFTSVANFSGHPIQFNQILHWRFSLQDATPARLVISDFKRVGISYNFNDFVDQYFQYKHVSWPGKITALGDLLNWVTLENADLLARPQSGFPNGATMLPNQGATGKWRITTYNGKKYIVMPNGNLFWSFGLNGVHDWMATGITGREHMFDQLPSTTGPNGDLYLNIATAQGSTITGYQPVRHNLRMKFGQEYFQPWREWTQRRLSSWGVNTVGGWSEYRIADGTRPYVYVLRTTDYPNHIVTPLIAWGPPPDPFSSDFQSWSTSHFIQELAAHAGRENLMGVYVDNELSWGMGSSSNKIERHSVAVGTLASPRNQPAKVEFIKTLIRKYRTIARLNSSWRTTFPSFDAMNNPFVISSSNQITGAMEKDFRDFTFKFAACYFTKVRAALTAANFQGLYLGCRFFQQTAEVIKAASSSVDILTFNDYNLPDQYTWAYYNSLAKPIMISEWSCPINDQGTLGFHNMSYPEREATITELLSDAASQPNVVGIHWFELYDQPVTNRGYDYENIGYGVVDVTDTPHSETIRAFRNFANNLYNIRN